MAGKKGTGKKHTETLQINKWWVATGIVLMQRNMKVQKLSVQFQQPGIKPTVVSFKLTAHGIRSLLHNQQTILCKLIFKPAYVHTTDMNKVTSAPSLPVFCSHLKIQQLWVFILLTAVVPVK